MKKKGLANVVIGAFKPRTQYPQDSDSTEEKKENSAKPGREEVKASHREGAGSIGTENEGQMLPR